MSRLLVIDTSVLLAIFERQVSFDLSSVIEMAHPSKTIVLSSCMDEIRRKLRSGSQMEKLVASSIIEALKRLGVKEERALKACDEAIVEFCQDKKGVIVATFDIELKKKLLDKGIPVIYLRAGKKLMLEEPGIR